MNTKSLSLVLAGLVAGIAITLTAGYAVAPRLMFVATESPLGHDQTVEAIQVAAAASGWKIPKVHRLNIGLRKLGHEVAPVSVVELCQPEYAARVLADDAGRSVSSMMPCRVSVYDTGDGRVMISRLNSGLLGSMFDEPVSEIMRMATVDTEAIIASVFTTATPIASRADCEQPSTLC